jgi:dipeptidyl aminopeptidase/acylaminoacyl peptidase
VDDRGRGTPSFSPTGKYVAFAAQEIDAVSMVMDIYVIDRDGGNVRKLTEDMSYKSFPVWSPDERWITYCAVPVNEPAESTRVYLIRTDKPGQARLIARGTYSMWFNERQFALFGGMVTSIASIDRDSLERFSEDSVFAVPILEEKYVGGYDFHKKQQGWWITTASSYKSSALSKAKRLGFSYLAAFAKGGKELFYWKDDSRELHRMRLPDGRDERVKGRFPGLGASFGIRSDGEEIVYRDSFTKSRFVLVENLLK